MNIHLLAATCTSCVDVSQSAGGFTQTEVFNDFLTLVPKISELVEKKV